MDLHFWLGLTLTLTLTPDSNKFLWIPNSLSCAKATSAYSHSKGSGQSIAMGSWQLRLDLIIRTETETEAKTERVSTTFLALHAVCFDTRTGDYCEDLKMSYCFSHDRAWNTSRMTKPVIAGCSSIIMCMVNTEPGKKAGDDSQSNFHTFPGTSLCHLTLQKKLGWGWQKKLAKQFSQFSGDASLSVGFAQSVPPC